MRLRTLALTILLSVLMVSCVSTGSGKVVVTVPPTLSAPDKALLKRCLSPVDLSKFKNGMTQEEAEASWGTDRKSLIECQRLKDALSDFVTEQQRLYRGSK